MTKPDGNVQDDVSPSWGTWEELLLAFAVNRYGTGAWDSIAAELQKRSSHPAVSLTAQNCRLKYLDLKRRFFTQNDDLVGDDKSNDDESVPLLEELKKLRVAELRREVQRYDLNIESLELKMKRMEEERDRSSRSEKSASDLEKKYEEKRSGEPEAKPENGGEPVTGEESEKDQMSVNESNSTDLGAEKLRTGEKQTAPARTGGEEVRHNRSGETSQEPAKLKTEPDGKSVGEDSCNGSSNSIEKEPDREAKAEAVSASSQLVGSEAESKGGREEPMKEYSDTQSSASRSRKEEEEEKDKVRRRSTSGDERDDEDQSRAVKELSAELQPLVDFLQAIRSHKLGSVFGRRLRSQETLRYQKLIRQHVDLQTIETRLKEGWYSGSCNRFFRDLLLLINNALVFYAKSSSEVNAAVEIRRLVSKEMSQKSAKSDSSSGKQISLQSLSNLKKEEPEAPHSLLLKPRLSGSLIVCRKRSSIAAKASGSSSGADRKKEQTALLADEKNTKLQLSQSSDNADEPKLTKKRTRDRFPLVSANAKKNGKKQGNNNDSKNSLMEPGKQQGKGGSSSQNTESKSENKKNQSAVDSKKRGAANFLNRMKQGSSSNNGLLLAALKNTPLTSESGSGKGGGSEQKKNDNTKRAEKKEHVTRRSTEMRQAKEKGSPTKRNVGRPPKRGAAPAPAPAPSPASGKRGRERGEVESSGSKQPKKRSRKL